MYLSMGNDNELVIRPSVPCPSYCWLNWVKRHRTQYTSMSVRNLFSSCCSSLRRLVFCIVNFDPSPPISYLPRSRIAVYLLLQRHIHWENPSIFHRCSVLCGQNRREWRYFRPNNASKPSVDRDTLDHRHRRELTGNVHPIL